MGLKRSYNANIPTYSKVDQYFPERSTKPHDILIDCSKASDLSLAAQDRERNEECR